MTNPEAFCDNPRHTLTTITEGDYIRCGDCGSRLRDDDPRQSTIDSRTQSRRRPMPASLRYTSGRIEAHTLDTPTGGTVGIHITTGGPDITFKMTPDEADQFADGIHDKAAAARRLTR